MDKHNKFNQIKNIFGKKTGLLPTIDDEQALDKIYNLVINNIFNKPTKDIEYLYFAHYSRQKKDKNNYVNNLYKASESKNSIIKACAILLMCRLPKHLLTNLKPEDDTSCYKFNNYNLVVELIPTDKELNSLELYIKAIASTNLIMRYSHGIGVEKDILKAKNIAESMLKLLNNEKEFEDCLKQVIIPIKISLGNIYKMDVLYRDLDKSIKLYESVINEGDNVQKADAMFRLASLYTYGKYRPKTGKLILEKDPIKAFNLYEQIVDIGINKQKCRAYYYLARMYENGFYNRCYHNQKDRLKRKGIRSEAELIRLEKRIKKAEENAEQCENCATKDIKKAISLLEKAMEIGKEGQKDKIGTTLRRLYEKDGLSQERIEQKLDKMYIDMVCSMPLIL